MSTMRKALVRVVNLLGLPTLLVAGYWMLSSSMQNPFFPAPPDIATAFVENWTAERFTEDVVPSLSRLAAGIGAAVVLGVGLGVLIGSSRTLRSILEPVLEFLRAIPPPVLVPLLVLLAGIGSTTQVLVIVSGCIWPILLNTVEGVRAVDSVLTDTCRIYRITGLARLRHLVVRAASPQIMAGVRQALSIGIILMVISEMFASSSGLGFTIVQFQRSFAMASMWSGIVLLGLIGFGLAMAFRLVEARVLSWYFGLRRAQRAS